MTNICFSRHTLLYTIKTIFHRPLTYFFVFRTGHPKEQKISVAVGYWGGGGEGGCTVDPSSPQTITLQVAGLHLCTKKPTSPTFILRAQESLPKLPINVSTKVKRIPKSAHIIPTNLISTLHNFSL